MKIAISALTAFTLAFGPATPVLADAGDFVAGAIIGGLIGSEVQKNQKKKRRTVIRSTQGARDIQASLNYFLFPVGAVDGQLGRRSRAAIGNFQVYMGFAATGALTPFERDILVTSYRRGQLGGAEVSQIIANSPDGRRGLLKSYRAEITGASAQVVASTSTETTTASTDSTLPTFFDAESAPSLASHCNQVALTTSANGGYTSASTLVDANFALNEQFCLARSYAISTGEELMAQVSGATPQQIAQQCQAFGPALQEHVAALSLSPMREVNDGVSGFVVQTGMTPSQLAGTAKICLSVGYSTDDMDVAVGSALLLFALGDRVYGELLGHHLLQGIGAARRADLAFEWFAAALDALEGGATAAFAPGQNDRVELLRVASGRVVGSQSAGGGSTLPVFNVSE